MSFRCLKKKKKINSSCLVLSEPVEYSVVFKAWIWTEPTEHWALLLATCVTLGVCGPLRASVSSLLIWG